MENRRRIGNDYTFTWPFEVRTGEQTTQPYDLTGRVFKLYMVGQKETFEIPADEIEVSGNEVTWTWYGKDQRYPGLYNAKLVENGGEDGMITVDVKYAVTLVPHTWQEGGSDDGCISLESVELVATEVSMTPGPRGPQGEQGPAGPQGETGPAGPQGAPGTAGPQGPEGKSAYEVAVDNGFEGTEEEWLESLHGGPRGPQGYSAYEVAVNEGYEGTETEWLASLKGETGATGATGPQGPQGVQGATGPQGPTGATGAQGQQGETGPQGPKGDTGETGATGPQGETGATGPQGPKGDTGDPGITSASVSVDANTGTPSVDASITNKILSLAFHNLKGETGATGAAGATGPAGERGGKWLEIASTPTAYTTQVGDFLPSYRVSKSAVLTQAGVDDVIVGDILVNSYYVYGVGYVDNDYVYTTARASIRGEKGATGNAATIAVGTVTTGAAGSSASVTNNGSAYAATFDFTIPKGDKGDTGETGATGEKGEKGDTGDPGITGATVSVDSSSGTPSAQASITNKILALAFSGLKGETGPQGAAGASGAAGADGVGIASVVQTVESTTPGGTNVITITKTDGTSSTVNVRNGDAVGSATIVQTTGDSTTAVMSQDGTTKAIAAGAQSVKTGTSIIFPNYSVTKLNATQVAALNAAEEITIKWVMKPPSLNQIYRYAVTCALLPYYAIRWNNNQAFTVSPTLNEITDYLGKHVNNSTAALNSTWSNQCVVINRVTGRVRWYQNTTLLVDETSDDYKSDYFVSTDGYLLIGMGDYETRVYALQIYDYDVTRFWKEYNKAYGVSWTSGTGSDIWSTVKGNLLKYGYTVSERRSSPMQFYGGNGTGRTVTTSNNWTTPPTVSFADGTAVAGTSSTKLGYWDALCEVKVWNLNISGGVVSMLPTECKVYDSNGDEISDYTNIGAGDYLVENPVVAGPGANIAYVSGSPVITETSIRTKAICCVVDMKLNATYDGKLIDNEAGTEYPFYKSGGLTYANCGTAWTRKTDAGIILSNIPLQVVYDGDYYNYNITSAGCAPPISGDIYIRSGVIYYGDAINRVWKQINNA